MVQLFKMFFAIMGKESHIQPTSIFLKQASLDLFGLKNAIFFKVLGGSKIFQNLKNPYLSAG